MGREAKNAIFLNKVCLGKGVTYERIKAAVGYVHDTLDLLDDQLQQKGLPKMTGLVELANLSSIIGNIFASGYVAVSKGAFSRAEPHKYQDLRTTGLEPEAVNIEVKIALEKNNPKGHLAKSGNYITCRYVLATENRVYTFGDWKVSLANIENADEEKEITVNAVNAKVARQDALEMHPGWDTTTVPVRPGDIAWIWEVRFGCLEQSHFNISNTEGDSGKTAVINANGMEQLKVVYFDPRLCPFSKGSVYVKNLKKQNGGKLPLF